MKGNFYENTSNIKGGKIFEVYGKKILCVPTGKKVSFCKGGLALDEYTDKDGNLYYC